MTRGCRGGATGRGAGGCVLPVTGRGSAGEWCGCAGWRKVPAVKPAGGRG